MTCRLGVESWCHLVVLITVNQSAAFCLSATSPLRSLVVSPWSSIAGLRAFVASPVELPRTNDRRRTAGDLTTNDHFSVSFRPCACRRPCARLYALACERRLSSRASCRQISSRPCDRRRHHPRLRPCERR